MRGCWAGAATFWLRLKGTNADGSDFEAPYWRTPENKVDDEFNRYGFFEQNFPAAPLQGLANRSVLTLEFMAGLQGSEELSLAEPFAHRNYIVLTESSDAPKILSVRDQDGEVPDGADTRYTVSSKRQCLAQSMCSMVLFASTRSILSPVTGRTTRLTRRGISCIYGPVGRWNRKCLKSEANQCRAVKPDADDCRGSRQHHP